MPAAALAHRPEEKKSPASPGPKGAPEPVEGTLSGASAGMPLFLRKAEGGESATGAPEDPQRESGPCAILVGDLTNEGLLYQLNRARLYLTQHQRGEGEWYDYANLLRRLTAERRLRIRAGHVWLAEPGLLHVPPLFYALRATGSLEISVERLDGAAVADQPLASQATLLTPEQFDRFLAQRGIPVVDVEEQLAHQDPTQPNPLFLNLPPELRTVSQAPVLSVDPGPSDRLTLQNFAPYGLLDGPGFVGGGVEVRGFAPPPVTYVVPASQVLSELGMYPDLVASGGPERVFLPAESPPVSTLPLSGMSSLGFFGQPDAPLPANATGVLWEGTHVSDFVVLNGRIFPRGFRASMFTHGWSTAERWAMTGGGPTTARLNVGTPGTYANDALFPYFPSAVAIARRDGTRVEAEELMRLMAAAESALEGQEYRYSSPSADSPTGQAALRRAERLAARRGLSGWCPPGARNCINLPMALHDVALGGHHMELPSEGGVPIDLADPHAASVPNMRRFADLPDSFFEERGLVRVRVGPRMLGGVGISGLLGAGAALTGDALLSPDGASPHYVRDAAFGFGSSAAGSMAESYATNFATSRLVGTGIASGSSATLGRLAGGTGVALVLTPLVTAGSMAFDDEQYTRIDYAARMGRSTVAAGGSALATGVFFALMGSEVPVLGNVVGFVIGIGVYAVTDQAIGEETEEAIREGLGEGGCPDGVGAGR